ncbi:carotenoid oxygenase family protein [Usitatibacter palustris]|uniref:Apocarotenoid-15,15'-oxygenase n=1 Tax=Usitatibacter palustris TaxID=2732487 RepID=A0A6M4H5U1_9PROT|nr:carotenoid oxygenase family protein [Usitatibacter palustris]QJR14545.1 Apocarotenoid-15,15'-oxygenase [Usitatibacter palustris]
MERRAFLSSVAATGLVAALPTTGMAKSGTPAFNPRHTPMRGFDGQDVSCDSLAIEGKLPPELRGTFFRNGPGLFERGGERYLHPFDGDGLVHAYRFTDKGVSHRARFVRTEKFKAEAQAGKFLINGFGTRVKAGMPITSSDSFNTANTSVLLLKGQLLALWEGGSAYALDPNTLETIGPVAFSRELAKLPFSAHPKVEPDGTTWNFGAFGKNLVLYHFAPDGTLVRSGVVESGGVGMVHDFVVTERHIVFVLPPAEFDFKAFSSGKAITESIIWHPDRPTRVLAIDKSDFSRRREYELEAFSLFHFGNAWEDAQGVIRADFVRSDNLSLMIDWMPRMMAGESIPAPTTNAAFLTADPSTGKARLEMRTGNCEFPAVDPRIVGRRHRQLFMPGSVRNDGYSGFDYVMRLDPETGKEDRYVFEAGVSLEEHIVVPRPGSCKEGDGWLVGVGFDSRRQQSLVNVFEAGNLAAGPVAIARLPYWVPSCFHGRWV